MDKHNNNTDLGQKGQGRQPSHQDNQENVSASSNEDISQADRQEGDMDNGELGGNFGSRQKEESSQDNP